MYCTDTSQSDLLLAIVRRMKRMDPRLFSKFLLAFYVEIQLKIQYITVVGPPITYEVLLKWKVTNIVTLIIESPEMSHCNFQQISQELLDSLHFTIEACSACHSHSESGKIDFRENNSNNNNNKVFGFCSVVVVSYMTALSSFRSCSEPGLWYLEALICTLVNICHEIFSLMLVFWGCLFVLIFIAVVVTAVPLISDSDKEHIISYSHFPFYTPYLVIHTGPLLGFCFWAQEFICFMSQWNITMMV